MSVSLTNNQLNLLLKKHPSLQKDLHEMFPSKFRRKFYQAHLKLGDVLVDKRGRKIVIAKNAENTLHLFSLKTSYVWSVKTGAKFDSFGYVSANDVLEELGLNTFDDYKLDRKGTILEIK